MPSKASSPSSAAPGLAWRRGLLKLSGESLAGIRTGARGFDPQEVRRLARGAVTMAEGRQLAVVIGAGNIMRGKRDASLQLERLDADAAGMVATVVNALVFAAALRRLGAEAEVFSAFAVGAFTRPYAPGPVRELLDAGGIAVLAGGTGNPFFSTDTAAALRARELACDVLFKATNVDGVYDKDPRRSRSARRYKSLSYEDALRFGPEVMDRSAFALLAESKLPLLLFNSEARGAFAAAAAGKGRHTLVSRNATTELEPLRHGRK